MLNKARTGSFMQNLSAADLGFGLRTEMRCGGCTVKKTTFKGYGNCKTVSMARPGGQGVTKRCRLFGLTNGERERKTEFGAEGGGGGAPPKKQIKI